MLTPPRRWHPAAALAGCVVLVLTWAVPLTAAPPPSDDDKVTLTGDRVEYNAQSRIARADGHVEMTGRGMVITADHLEADLEKQDVVATGNVTLRRSGNEATGTLLRYNLRTRVGRMEQMTVESPPWHVTGDAIDMGPNEDVAYGASITSCDPAHPLYKVTARKIEIVPGDRITAYDASLWVAGVHIITVPQYSSVVGRSSGPSVGANTLDGLYLEYKNSFPVGDFLNEYRLRLATSSRFAFEDVLSEKFKDHVFAVHLGRWQLYDTSGNLANVDRYSADLQYDWIRIAGTPVAFSAETHVGSYGEIATGVTTTRFDTIVNVSTEAFRLSPSLSLSFGGQFRFDAYGVGQLRTYLNGATALATPVGDRGNASLSYGVSTVTGTSPFQFDHLDPSSAITLNYSYSFGGGFLETLSTYLSYDFLAQQYTSNLSLAMRITSTLLFNVTATYNLTTQQLTEVDYAINAKCDCLTVGLLFRTFPQSPSANSLNVTVNLNAF